MYLPTSPFILPITQHDITAIQNLRLEIEDLKKKLDKSSTQNRKDLQTEILKYKKSISNLIQENEKLAAKKRELHKVSRQMKNLRSRSSSRNRQLDSGTTAGPKITRGQSKSLKVNSTVDHHHHHRKTHYSNTEEVYIIAASPFEINHDLMSQHFNNKHAGKNFIKALSMDGLNHLPNLLHSNSKPPQAGALHQKSQHHVHTFPPQTQTSLTDNNRKRHRKSKTKNIIKSSSQYPSGKYTEYLIDESHITPDKNMHDVAYGSNLMDNQRLGLGSCSSINTSVSTMTASTKRLLEAFKVCLTSQKSTIKVNRQVSKEQYQCLKDAQFIARLKMTIPSFFSFALRKQQVF